MGDPRPDARQSGRSLSVVLVTQLTLKTMHKIIVYVTSRFQQLKEARDLALLRYLLAHSSKTVRHPQCAEASSLIHAYPVTTGGTHARVGTHVAPCSTGKTGYTMQTMHCILHMFENSLPIVCQQYVADKTASSCADWAVLQTDMTSCNHHPRSAMSVNISIATGDAPRSV